MSPVSKRKRKRRGREIRRGGGGGRGKGIRRRGRRRRRKKKDDTGLRAHAVSADGLFLVCSSISSGVLLSKWTIYWHRLNRFTVNTVLNYMENMNVFLGLS